LDNKLQEALDKFPEYAAVGINASQSVVPEDLPDELLRLMDDCGGSPPDAVVKDVETAFSEIIEGKYGNIR
jgi:hypothetical protein